MKVGITKSAKEIEIEVNDFNQTYEMLVALGYQVYKKSKKNRISYKLGNVRIEFDKFLDHNSFIPEFMELESTNVEDIEELVRKLGFKIEDCKNWGGYELLNFYKKPN